MLLDLHMHEKTCSADSFLALDKMVRIAKERGLDGICVTDHDSMGLKDYAHWFSRKTGFPIFVGIEYYSLQGDIVAFGLDEYPSERVSAQEFIDCVKDQGGITIAAHPFRDNNRGLEENLLKVKGLDGVEVLNGSTKPDACEKAAQYAGIIHAAMVGSSDCHVTEKVGVCATYVADTIHNETELAEAVRSRRTAPLYWKDGKYRLYEKVHLPFDARVIEYVYK